MLMCKELVPIRAKSVFVIIQVLYWPTSIREEVLIRYEDEIVAISETIEKQWLF